MTSGCGPEFDTVIVKGDEELPMSTDPKLREYGFTAILGVLGMLAEHTTLEDALVFAAITLAVGSKALLFNPVTFVFCTVAVEFIAEKPVVPALEQLPLISP
jgi:hypothetical protein